MPAERLSLFRERLAVHGFVDGRNLSVAYKFPAQWTQASREAAARELIALQPDALLCFSTLLTRAGMAASRSVPIVFVWVADPVASSIVKSYGRPGGNATGVSLRYFELGVKRLELVRELLPSAKRIAVYSSVFDSQIETLLRTLQRPAESLGFELVQADGRAGMRQAVDGAVRAGSKALVMLDPLAVFGRLADAKDIAAYTIERRVPLVGTDIETCELGGLISYATNLNDDLRRGADLVARVLRGDKPAELPVDQAARFDLVVNLGTARGIGITVPQSILARADRVIE